MNAKTMIIKTIGKTDRKVQRYGKLTKTIAYELSTVNHRHFDYSNEHAMVVFVEEKDGKLICRNDMTRVFYPEEEPTGGRFVGKRYKSDLELANEYLASLKQASS